MEDITISVVVPCYNCEKSIDKCVNSLLNQTVPFNEIILVDDGSVDRTTQIVDQYENEYENIVSISKTNGGLVSAWKAGVGVSTCRYIAFCDSDDYVDEDFVAILLQHIKEYFSDIYLFDAVAEYDDGSNEVMSNLLPHGLYIGQKLENIKRTYLFTGKMQSNTILNSRWSKLFRSEILVKCLDDISDNLTNGEDAVTTYVAIMNSNSICVIDDFHPYHYVRNNLSMVGKYDPNWYEKQLFHRNELVRLSEVYNCNNIWQIDNYFFSFVLMYIKKEICRSQDGLRKVISNIRDVYEKLHTSIDLCNICTSEYTMGSKFFSFLFLKKHFISLYVLTKVASEFGYGKK